MDSQTVFKSRGVFANFREGETEHTLLLTDRMGFQHIYIDSDAELDPISQAVLGEREKWQRDITVFVIEFTKGAGPDRKAVLRSLSYVEGKEPIGSTAKEMSDTEYENIAHRAWLSAYG